MRNYSSFQGTSVHRDASTKLIDYLIDQNQLISMPAHGWFEVWCNLNRLSEIDKTYVHPIFRGEMHFPLELIHIDKEFILYDFLIQKGQTTYSL